MEDEDDLIMSAMPPNASTASGLARVAADFKAAVPQMLEESRQRRAEANQPLARLYEQAAAKLRAQRKELPWHRIALAASEGMLAPMRYSGIGAGFGNVMSAVNPILDRYEQRSFRTDDQLLGMQAELAKLERDAALADAQYGEKLGLKAVDLERDANKTEWVRSVDPVTGEVTLTPVSPASVAQPGVPKYLAYARGPGGQRMGYDGANWVPVQE